MPKCVNCGKEAGKFFYCANCGALVKEECPSCKEWVDVSMEFCPKCGKRNRLHIK